MGAVGDFGPHLRVRGIGLITFGENWHGNHHAFPHSARLGVEPGQVDPGFWFIRTLEWLRLASAIRLPDSEPPRAGLVRVEPEVTDGLPHLTG